MNRQTRISSQILQRDVISIVASYLDKIDLISLCIAHAPLQSVLRPLLRDLGILRQPLCLMEYDIPRCRRLTDLLHLSYKENLTSFHMLPKTLHIREYYLNNARSNYSPDVILTPDGLDRGARESFDLKCDNLVSKIAESCHNITELIYEADETSLRGQDNILKLLDAVPPLKSIKKLWLYSDTPPAIQACIARIIGPSQLEEFKYVTDERRPSVHPDLVNCIRNQKCLESLTVLGRKTLPSLSSLIVELASNFCTISRLHIDDRSWESFDRVHVLELVSSLDLPNLKSFKYDATLYESLTSRPSRQLRQTRRPARRPARRIRVFGFPLALDHPPALDDPDDRDLPVVGNLPLELGFPILNLSLPPILTREETGYLETNKGPMISKFLRDSPNLENVVLTCCTFLNDTFFVSAWEWLPNLRTLEIKDCPDIHGVLLSQSTANGWTKLTRLDLATCKNVTTQCMLTIAAATTAQDVELVFYSNTPSIQCIIDFRMQQIGYQKVNTSLPSCVVYKRTYPYSVSDIQHVQRRSSKWFSTM